MRPFLGPFIIQQMQGPFMSNRRRKGKVPGLFLNVINIPEPCHETMGTLSLRNVVPDLFLSMQVQAFQASRPMFTQNNPRLCSPPTGICPLSSFALGTSQPEGWRDACWKVEEKDVYHRGSLWKAGKKQILGFIIQKRHGQCRTALIMAIRQGST